MIAVHLLLVAADNDKYRSARNRLKEDYLLNEQKHYPRTLLQCFNMLKGWSIDHIRHDLANNRLEVAFNTVGEEEDQESKTGAVLVNKVTSNSTTITILLTVLRRSTRTEQFFMFKVGPLKKKTLEMLMKRRAVPEGYMPLLICHQKYLRLSSSTQQWEPEVGF